MTHAQTTLTFLFTDIEGSTHLWEQQPALMRNALARQEKILRQAISGHDGRIFRTVGDAFCAVFNNAPDALHAAVQAQQSLCREEWELDEPLRVRLVLHTGRAEAVKDDYIGASLNRLGRMQGVCHGGQTLVSAATETLVRGRLPENVVLVDLGQHRLRDLVQPEHIYQVAGPGLLVDFPPLASLDAMPNNLPIPLTPFLGRQRELDEAQQMLRETRLLTMTGPGGTGKTRLAIQTAADALSQSLFPDGAWLVELAPVTHPDLVLPATAAVLKVHESSGRDLRSALMDHLRYKNLLLILDNCEHLIEGSAELSEILLQCGPGIKLLVSSREPLGIAGESVFRVPSFTLPDPGASIESLLENESVQLFIERTRAVKPGIVLTPLNAPSVIQICHRLDGIPLAIELAAARSALFTPQEIAKRLDDRFRLLTGGNRLAMPRQQTLEALIDWSYGLLSEDNKRLFHSLSVFPGSFTYEAAEAVNGGDILETLAELVNKSLVLMDEDPGEGSTRYRMLETIRQYAQVKLLSSGEIETSRDRHMQYYLLLSKEIEDKIPNSSQRPWILLLIKERDNLRAAIEWALERSPNTALEIIGSQAYFLSGQQGLASEGMRWVEMGIEKSLQAQTHEEDALHQKEILARAFWAKGVLATSLGQGLRSVAALEESVRLWREVGDPYGLSRSLSYLGFRGSFISLPNRYLDSAKEGLAIARELNFYEAIGTALTAIGREAMWVHGDYEAARTIAEEALEKMQKTGNEKYANLGRMTLGFVALHQNDFESARRWFKEAMQVFKEIGDPFFVNILRSGLADTDRLDKKFARAVKLYLEAIDEWQKFGNVGAIARCFECIAFIASELTLQEIQTLEDHKIEDPQISDPQLLRITGNLFGTAESIRASSGEDMTPDERVDYNEVISKLRALCSRDALEAGWREGLAQTVEQGIAVVKSFLTCLILTRTLNNTR